MLNINSIGTYSAVVSFNEGGKVYSKDYTDGNKRQGVRFSRTEGRGRFLEVYRLKDGKTLDVWCADKTLLQALTAVADKAVKVHEKDLLKYSAHVEETVVEELLKAEKARKAEEKARKADTKKSAQTKR